MKEERKGINKKTVTLTVDQGLEATEAVQKHGKTSGPQYPASNIYLEGY